MNQQHLSTCIHHGSPLLANGYACICPCHTVPSKAEEKCGECQHDQPDTYGHSQACSKWVARLAPTDTTDTCSCGSPKREGWKHSPTVCGGLSSSRPTDTNGDWHEHLDPLLIDLLNIYELKSAFFANRPTEEFDNHPYPEFYKIKAFIATELERAREEGEKQMADKIWRITPFEAGRAAALLECGCNKCLKLHGQK